LQMNFLKYIIIILALWWSQRITWGWVFAINETHCRCKLTQPTIDFAACRFPGYIDAWMLSQNEWPQRWRVTDGFVSMIRVSHCRSRGERVVRVTLKRCRRCGLHGHDRSSRDCPRSMDWARYVQGECIRYSSCTASLVMKW
jgi:hypothetical protein